MKMKLKLTAILAVFLFVFTSCEDEPTVPSGPTGLTDEVYFEEIGTVDSIGLVEHYELLLQQTTANNAEASPEYLALIQEQLANAEEYTQECINQSGANWDEGVDGKGAKNRLIGYQYTTIRYKSIDHNGKPVMLSTLVVWPYNMIFANPTPQNVIIGCHVTIGSNAERPTNYNKNTIKSDVGLIACCARKRRDKEENKSNIGNLVIMPDYQGYGATHGEVHPYLSQDLTARQVLDGVRAGIKFYNQKQGKLGTNWKSVSTGYSQGGSVAMAVHRYIEKNNLVDEFHFAGSVCGAGPYDPIATLTNYTNTNQLYMPVAAAMMMYSMCNTNPRLMGKYTINDFLSEKFINSGVITRIKEKRLNTDEMQEQLFQYSAKFEVADTRTFCMYRLSTDNSFYPYRKDTKDSITWKPGYIATAWAKTSETLHDECYNYFRFNQAPQSQEKLKALQAFKAALEDNVLYRDWTPAHPIFLYHSVADEVVVFENYQNCLNAWTGSDMVKGTRYNGLTKTHVNYGSIFFLLHCDEGLNAILDNNVDKFKFDRLLYGI